MDKRELDILEAERIVSIIRKNAKLTPQESRYLTVKLNSPVHDFSDMPTELLEKLRDACRRLNITYKGERL